MSRLGSFLLFTFASAGLILTIAFKGQLLNAVRGKLPELETLRLENKSLELERDRLAKTQAPVSRNRLTLKPADVYSTYPANNRKLAKISLGSEDGIAPMMSVLAAPEILFGYVTEVFPHYSIVRTVNDPEFKVPVRFEGVQGEGLFEGGSVPHVRLIDKKLLVQGGERIYSASYQFPYGMKIGTVGALTESTDSYFKEAEVALDFAPSALVRVYVIVDYVPKP